LYCNIPSQLHTMNGDHGRRAVLKFLSFPGKLRGGTRPHTRCSGTLQSDLPPAYSAVGRHAVTRPHAASLELTAGKEQRNRVSQCNAEVYCVTTAHHYRGKNGLDLIN